jgi:hypothetical protein
LLFVLLIAARLAAAQFPEARLWGVNFGAFLPVWAQLLLAALGVLCATPVLLPLFRWKAELFERSSLLLLTVAAAAGTGLLFWLLRMETVFLGDGASYLAEHFRYVRGLPFSEDVLLSPGSAPLTAWLLAKTALAVTDTAAQSGLAAQPQLVWWVYAAVTGAAYVAAVLLLARRAGDDGAQRLTLTALLLLSPGVLFFFGYVEYYTFAYAALGIFLLLSLAVLRGRAAAAWLPVAFLLLTAFHIMMLVSLPGLLLTLALRSENERVRALVSLRNVLLATGIVLLVGAIYYFASGIAADGSRVILALSPFGEEGAVQHYTLLSPAHLGDVLNMLILAAGPSLLVLVFVPWKARPWKPEEVVFLTHLLYFGFLLFFGYTCFGMARDWDVNAGLGLAAAVFAVLLLSRRERAERDYLYLLVSGAALVAVLPWVAVNVDSDFSERRFRSVVALDDESITGDFALNGYEHLRKYYQSKDDREQVAWAIRRKTEMVGYPEDYRKLMLEVVSSLRGQAQREYLDWIFDSIEQKLVRMREEGKAALYEGTRAGFIELYAEFLQQLPFVSSLRGEEEEYFRSRLDRFRSAAGTHPLVNFADALHASEVLGREIDVQAMREAAAVIEGSSFLAVTCGRSLLAAGAYGDARSILERGIVFDSTFTLPHYYLGQAYASGEGADPEAAITHFQQFVSTPEGHRIPDGSVQRQLIDDARRRLGELELQRLQYP